MDEKWGDRLHAARRRAGIRSQGELADILGVSKRTVGNYERAVTRPIRMDPVIYDRLVQAVGHFENGDDERNGDPVEDAVRSCPLTEDRQYALLSLYKRLLREQEVEAVG